MDDSQNGIFSSRHPTTTSATPESTTHTPGPQRRLLSLKDMDETLVSSLNAQNRLLIFEVPNDKSPGLFILLPSTNVSNEDPSHAFLRPFQLHVLCESGFYENQVEGDFTALDAAHLADHPGYCLQRPTKLFKKLFPAMLVSAEAAKIIFLTVSLMVPAANLDWHQITAIERQLRAKKGRCDTYTNEDLKSLMDEAIEFISSVSQDEKGPEITGVCSTLEGAIEAEVVRMEEVGELAALLGKEDSQFLGNLHLTTKEGCPRWVCRAHLWKFDPEEAQKQFLQFVSNNGGYFEEGQEKLTIKLNSPVEARTFYQNLIHDDRVRELDIFFRWVTTRSDLQDLATALRKSRTIVSLHLGGLPHISDTPIAKVVHTAFSVVETAASLISGVPNIMSEIAGRSPVYGSIVELLTDKPVHEIYAPLLTLLEEGPLETMEIHSAEFLDSLLHLPAIPWIHLEALSIHGIRTDKRKRLFLQFLKRCPDLRTLHLSDIHMTVPSLEVCAGLQVLILDRGILSSARDLKAVLGPAVALLKARKVTLQILIRSSLTTYEKDQVSIQLTEGVVSTNIFTNLRDDESLRSVIEEHGWASEVAS